MKRKARPRPEDDTRREARRCTNDDAMNGPKGKASYAYNRARFAIIVGLIATNSFYAVLTAVDHRYPFGLAAVLFLVPCLLRELDLRNGRPLRRLGTFGWSCFIAGFLFLGVLPFLIH
jgi:hypothetical protein